MTRTERRILCAIGDGELSGAEIMKQGGFWFVPWVSLLRLERKGVLISRWIDGNYPRRRVYKMTPQ